MKSLLKEFFFLKLFHWFVLKCTTVIVTNISCRLVWMFPHFHGLSVKFAAPDATCGSRVPLPGKRVQNTFVLINPCFKTVDNTKSSGIIIYNWACETWLLFLTRLTPANVCKHFFCLFDRSDQICEE